MVPPDQLLPRAQALAERIARVPEPSVRLNKAVTCYGLLAMGLGAGMLMNIPLSSMAHASYNAQRAELIGRTDRNAGTVTERPVSPKDILATTYHLLGIDPETTLTDRTGRPLPLVPDGSVVSEVLA